MMCAALYRQLRELLMKCAATSMSSKLVSTHKEFFTKMVVDAVMHLEEDLPIDMIGIKKVQVGGSLLLTLFSGSVGFLFLAFPPEHLYTWL